MKETVPALMKRIAIATQRVSVIWRLLIKRKLCVLLKAPEDGVRMGVLQEARQDLMWAHDVLDAVNAKQVKLADEATVEHEGD